jgi:predicted alpha/beta hydrolase
LSREHWVEAADGWQLNIVDCAAEKPWAIAVVGHAMMVDRRSVYREDRPSLATTLAAQGIRVLVPDLRGHGASGPGVEQGGRWSYDDMVADVGVYIAHARALEPELPLVLVGNSLFGHAALAYLGQHPEVRVSAMVGFAVNIWSRRWTATRPRWLLKRLLLGTAAWVTDALGHLPAPALGMGSDAEPRSYWQGLFGGMADDRWESREGADYAVGLSHVRAPFLHVISDGDRLLCWPADALRFSESISGREVLHLGSECAVESLRGLSPGHVEMVSSPRCLPVWLHTAKWLKLAVESASLDGPRPWR